VGGFPVGIVAGFNSLSEALAVRAAVAELTPRQRAAVVLRYFDDLDLATTAAVMRCSESTVKNLTSRGIAVLKDRLQFEVAEEEETHD
jgi:RNA polymerase sigma factor (sigma-70 family)